MVSAAAIGIKKSGNRCKMLDLMRFRPVFTIMYVLNGLCEWIESPVLMDPQLMIKTDHPL